MSADPASTIDLTVAQVQQTREALQRQGAAAMNRHAEAIERQSPTWLVSSLQLEVNQLKYLDLLLAQQIMLLEDRDELSLQMEVVDVDSSNWILDEIGESPPFSFLLLEKLSDDLADAESRKRTFVSEISTARDLLQHAKRNLQDGNRERRGLEERLRNTADSGERSQLERQLINADLYCQIGAGLVKLRGLDVEVKQLEEKAHERQLETLTGAVKIVQANALFSERDLADKLAQLDQQESKIQALLAEFQGRLAALTGSTQDSTGFQPSVSSRGATEARDTIRQAMSQLNESLADLVILRHAWKLRFRWSQGELPQREQRKTLEQLANFKQHATNSREALELRQKQLRQQLTQLESSGELTANGQEAELLRDVLRVGDRRAVLLHQVDRTLNRFEAALTEEKLGASFSEAVSNTMASAREWWGYEVIAVDDRPVTIGKIVSAVLMLLVGLYLSRRVSRMLGKRMLPRFGIHEARRWPCKRSHFICWSRSADS